MEPRSYLDVDQNNNFSELNNPKNDLSFGSESLRSTFSKVRVMIVPLKNGNYKELIDCGDFTYAKTTP